MKTVIVFGGSGYIGKEVIGQLLDKGYKVINIDKKDVNEVAYPKFRNVIYINIDLANMTQLDIYQLGLSIKETTEADVIEGVICFAAYKDLSESLNVPLEYYDNNIKIVLNTLRVSSIIRSKIYIFSSSAAVYDDSNTISCKEDVTPISNNTPYGSSKSMAELILKDSASALGLPCIALRYFNPVGNTENTKDESTSLFGNIHKCIENKQPGIIYGSDYEGSKDGTCIRDYIDIRDLAAAHIHFLDHRVQLFDFFDVFNVGTGSGTTVKEVMDAVKEVHPEFEYTIGPRRPGDVVGAYADTSKINSLGWNCNYSLTDTIKSLNDRR